jgi:hypothetical protein
MQGPNAGCLKAQLFNGGRRRRERREEHHQQQRGVSNNRMLMRLKSLRMKEDMQG